LPNDEPRPRPPDGDWLGTPYLEFIRGEMSATCTIDRPQARDALTPAMCFGIRYAISPVDRNTLSQICRTAPGARGEVKASLDRSLDLYDRIGMRRSSAGPEMLEGYRAFKEGRAPDWVHTGLRRDGRL